MLKVNNKNTRIYSTPFSSISILDFKQVNVTWEFSHFIPPENTRKHSGIIRCRVRNNGRKSDISDKFSTTSDSKMISGQCR